MIKKLLSYNGTYIVISLILAILFWLYVDVNSTEDYTATISNIPVVFDGEESLGERGLIIVHDSENEFVTLRVSGRRSDIIKLNASNIEITVRTSQIVSSGDQELEYTITYPRTVSESNITVVSRSPDAISVSVVAENSKSVPVRVEFTGSIAESYYQSSIACSPETVTVTGPQELVDTVSYVYVNIADENVSETIVKDYGFTLMDENGQEIISDELTCNTDTVTVSMKVGATKTVPLTVDIVSGGGATKANAKVTIGPVDEITISADAALLDTINEIEVGSIDLSQVAGSASYTWDVPLMEGVENLTGTTQVDVTVDITGLQTKQISVSNIQALNVPEGYDVEAVTGSLSILFRGRASAISELTEDNVTVFYDLSSVDLSNGAFGTITIPASIYLSGVNNVGAVGSYNIVVRITDK